MPIVADAAVKVGADLSQFNRDLKGADKPVQSLGQRIKSTLNPSALIGGGIALVGAAVVAGLAGAVKALIDIERLNAQTDAAIKSTGGAANVTRAQVEELAEAAEETTTIQRESVQEAANMLLTFTKVRNEIGEGNDIFNQATDAAMDMSVALGTDLTSAAMLVGKALNDPIRGMTAMTRAGIQFTDSQKDMIKALVASGDLLGAQTIILAELETQFGGSAEAFADTTAGKMQRAGNIIGNVFEGIVTGALDMGDRVGSVGAQWGHDLNAMAMDFGAMSDRIHGLADDVGIDFDTMKHRITDRMAETGESFDEAALSIERSWRTTGGDMRATAWQMMIDTSAAIEDGAEGMITAADFALSDPLITAMLGGKEEAERIAGETPGGIAQALIDAQFEVEDASASLAQAMEDALHPMIERAQIIAFLSSNELAEGLASGIPAVRARALELKEAAEMRLIELEGAAFGYGYSVGTSFGDGMNAAYGYVVTAAGNLARATRNQIGINSEPEDPTSPLRGITKWGGNIAAELASGMLGGVGGVRGAARALAAGLVPGFGIGPMSMSAAGGGAVGGNTYHVELVDKLEVRTVEDIGYGLKKLGDIGVLPGSKR